MLNKIYRLLHRLTSKCRERGHYSAGYWQDMVRKEALSSCRGARGKVLEIGCGEGLFLTQLASHNAGVEIWGIDNDDTRLKEAEKSFVEKDFKNINLSFGDATRLPFERGYFDIVICINVIFNMESVNVVKETLKEAKRVCKRLGRIVFDFRNGNNPLLLLKYRFAKYYDYTVRDLPLKTYRSREIESILRELNLRIVTKRFIGFPFKILAPIIIIEAENVD